ncbi:M23 family metallopeptidase [Streptomyces ochraceiscleroticus]|uniref:Peptidoglycan DD-metalloendopeptidase family protein n=1 Tax=Streptomyces ochraceiscleroticus TaxID=47761 RepID=A0ABW1MG35_9ACTN|nr:M23 family metallopeptidase [Streptomyces ochraceiscleroticus]
MNDRHPSGNPDPTGSAADASYGSYPGYESHEQQDAQLGYAAYDGYTTGTYDTGAYAAGTYDTGAYDASGAYDVTGTYDAYGAVPYDSGTYDTGAYDVSGAYEANGTYDGGTYPAGYETGTYDPYAYPSHDATGTYDTTGAYDASGAYDTGAYDVTGAYDTGTYDTGAYDTVGGAWPAAGGYEATPQDAQFETPQFEATQFGTGPFDTGQFDTGQFDTGSFDTGQFDNSHIEAGQFEAAAESTAVFTVDDLADPEAGAGAEDATDSDLHSSVTAIIPTPTLSPEAAPEGAPPGSSAAAPGGRRAARREAGSGGGRGRRRTPKKSALLTVAVPSVAAMGVCAVAAASVSGATDKDEDNTAVQAASEASAVKPSAANNKLDSQLSNLSADANDFADRASRTQERLDLQAREAAEKKRRAEEAARKEALRPKFALPVKQHGLSALFGQAGVNWMSLHSGIDFPVSYGTPVMAATDGTVVTKWNPAYGNMVELTAPDGTETWYCHLSSAKIRSGTVKAGDVIAYSGNSGNSTGPHLHFEVHPDGGDAIDPLPWLRSKGINPN